MTIKTTSVLQCVISDCQTDAENPFQEKKKKKKTSRAWRRGRLTSELLPQFVMFRPQRLRDTPQRSGHRVIRQVGFKWGNMLIGNDVKKKCIRRAVFKNTCQLLELKVCGFMMSSPFSDKQRKQKAEEEEAEERGRKKRETRSSQVFFFFFFFWKLICDPLMKSSSFGIKLNVQRYLSVGISLITLREVSDRLMQVLTWASPRTLYMYPATDRYC